MSPVVLISAASGCAHPQKKSARTAAMRSGWDLAHTRRAVSAWMKMAKNSRAQPLVFSRPGGRDGWVGNGRMRGRTEVGCVARRGERSGRLAGVVATVTRRSRLARRPVRSRCGSAWPCAGKGMMSELDALGEKGCGAHSQSDNTPI
ncbi:hypothetical protein PR202_ga10744 [Eleusine coracana subsp. coracana]|uniref:Uncharacterized protein n=1 Tax=Eleusine coracana subsp. coracana TaxID=191504 RepID=A0AAV5C7Q9_ELECO|nr:hypothetical protein PR202_ga10744 [Eleusine coracana subsp. coracana]